LSIRDVRNNNITFPLTPALSPRERGNGVAFSEDCVFFEFIPRKHFV
jgi:hypothetical protein